jgi:hypothetical protein
LPITRVEDRYLGSARDQFRHRAGDYMRQQWEKAKEVGRGAGSAAIEQAKEEGVTPDSIYGVAREEPVRF